MLIAYSIVDLKNFDIDVSWRLRVFTAPNKQNFDLLTLWDVFVRFGEGLGDIFEGFWVWEMFGAFSTDLGMFLGRFQGGF